MTNAHPDIVRTVISGFAYSSSEKVCVAVLFMPGIVDTVSFFRDIAVMSL